MPHAHTDTSDRYAQDMGRGFGHFIDRVLRGRDKYNLLFLGTVATASLSTGIPNASGVPNWSLPLGIINNKEIFSAGFWENFSIHNPFDFGHHGTPLFDQNLGQSMGLPDWPFGGIAHFAMVASAFYDVGRTFYDLWTDPALEHNFLKVITHPDMVRTALPQAVMIAVMATLHSLGPIIAIGVAHLCHKLTEHCCDLVQGKPEAREKLQESPILRDIYDASGQAKWMLRAGMKPAITPANPAPYAGL